MTHQLTQRENGPTEMAYVGQTPWHGLGQRLLPGASIENWSVAAGMNWTIRRSPVKYLADRAGADLRDWPEQQVLFRSDNSYPLGIVSPQYRVVQPYEVLEFFRELTDTQGFQLETAGTLFGGRRYWALAKIAEEVVAGWDRIGGYMLLTTSADGSFATEARETTVRVVCYNTLSMAVKEESGKHYVKLNHKQTFDSKAVQRQLGLGAEHFAAFAEKANELTKVKLTHAAAEKFLKGLFQPTQVTASENAQEDDGRKSRGYDMIRALFAGAGKGSTQAGSQGTAWGLVNAVTEYVDHLATAKSADHRLARAWWGSGNDLKTRAMVAAAEAYT
jgi:phage/plasmid-like protein (TIGR03299 family)